MVRDGLDHFEDSDIADNESCGDTPNGDGEATTASSVSQVMRDWSKTGRGPHVQFDSHEAIPLKQGRKLGRGAMGDVYETTIGGCELAWKRITFRCKLTSNQRKEIEILKKLSHCHMVQLVGTYTSRMELGLLLYPVALCDLHTFFEDVEAFYTGGANDEQRHRLDSLDNHLISSVGAFAYHRIGCLVSAIDYLHTQKIRHKDLKPSNILLSPGQIWLSDFGSATDFSLLSQSATDNERGTPRYFAPEVAAWEKNGRAADMFSLGCILLEILVLDSDGTLRRIRENRSTPNPAFHANLDNLDKWLPSSDDTSPRMHHLSKEVRSMLSPNPLKRPTARELLHRLTLADAMRGSDRRSIFGPCCRVEYISHEQHKKQMRSKEREIQSLRNRLSLLEAGVLSQKLQFGEDKPEKQVVTIEQDALGQFQLLVHPAGVKPDIATTASGSKQRTRRRNTAKMPDWDWEVASR